MKKYDAIVLIGAPGVGKGTQGKLLAQKPGYVHFSSGDCLRELPDSEMGRKVRAIIDGGNFIDDDLIIELTHEALTGYVTGRKFYPESDYIVLDGIPRNTYQARRINEFVDVRQVLHFKASDQVCKERIKQRFVKEGRADDNSKEKMEKRLKTYHHLTPDLLNFYGDLLTGIDARGPQGEEGIQTVHQRVLEVILHKG